MGFKYLLDYPQDNGFQKFTLPSANMFENLRITAGVATGVKIIVVVVYYFQYKRFIYIDDKLKLLYLKEVTF